MIDKLYYCAMTVLITIIACIALMCVVHGMTLPEAVNTAVQDVPCEASAPIEPPPIPEATEAASAVETVPVAYTDAELIEYIKTVCAEYGVPVELVCAIIEVESGWDAEAVSATNDHGIMQINACNHDSLATKLGVTDWYDARQNILAGVYLLAAPCSAYGDDYARIAMCYNLGCGRANRMWDEGVRRTGYTDKVMEVMECAIK